MDKKRRIKGRTIGNLCLFAAAALLLVGGSIGSARAALTYFSQTYTSRIQTQKIGVTLLENGNSIAWRNFDKKSADDIWDINDVPIDERLFRGMLGEDESFVMGKAYKEELAVRNSGTIDQYVRVNVYSYWVKVDENGSETKLQDRSPDLIDLNLVNQEHWIRDGKADTSERYTLYYDSILTAGETTPIFSDTLTVDGLAADHVTHDITKRDGYTVITTTYDYDGVEFRLEIEVNAVQTHNAEGAIWSSWGRKVKVSSDQKLSLVDDG